MWYMIRLCFFFFFSSRRRHTRFDCDWSSDVCSSDLRGDGDGEPRAGPQPDLGATGGVGGRPRHHRHARHVGRQGAAHRGARSEEHTSELQSQSNLVCRLLLEKKKNKVINKDTAIADDDSTLLTARAQSLI